MELWLYCDDEFDQMVCPPTLGENIHLVPRDTPEEREKRLNLDLSEIPVPLNPEPFLQSGNLVSSHTYVKPFRIRTTKKKKISNSEKENIRVEPNDIEKKKKKRSNRKIDCEDLRRQVLVRSVYDFYKIEDQREKEMQMEEDREMEMLQKMTNEYQLQYEKEPEIPEPEVPQPETVQKRKIEYTNLDEPPLKKVKQEEAISRPQKQQKPKPKGGLSKLQKYRQKVARSLGFSVVQKLKF